MSPDVNSLQVVVDQPRSWSRRLTITVPAPRVQQVRRQVTEQLLRNVRLPGFRKGKLPTHLIEQRFGPSIEQETLDRVIQEAYKEALQAQSLSPITQGQVQNVQHQRGEDLTFEVEFEVQPEVELNRVSGFTARRPSAAIGDEEVDSVLERLRDDHARLVPLPEGATPDFGDQVLVKIQPLDPDGAPKEGEEERSYRFFLGEGQAIAPVEEAIRTLTPGGEGTFTVQFPDDFPDEAQRGQEQYLRVRLESAEKKELPELNDEFATTVGDFASLEALRERIRADLEQDAQSRATAEVRGQLLDQIIEANAFEVPDSMLARYLSLMTGHAHDDGHRHTPEEEERISQLQAMLRPQALSTLKRMLVVDRLAEREGLRATQDEIDARVEELARKHERSVSELWLQLEKSGQLEALERELTEDKVFEFLQSQNTVA